MLTKVHIVKAMIFSISHVWIWELTVKKTEHWRIDAFGLWCWRRLFRVPWTSRRSNWSVLKEINPEYSLEGMMLKLQSFGHLMSRADSLEKPWCWERLKAEGEEDNRMKWFMASPTQWTWVWASCRSWWCTGKTGMLQSMGTHRVLLNWATELNCDYTVEVTNRFKR